MKRMFAWLGIVGMGAAVAASWPDLPTSGFIAGRTATMDDIKAGRAAFAAIGKYGERMSTPNPLTNPQYALLVKKGTQTPVIIIQAEDTPAGTTVGYKQIEGTAVGVCQLAEVKLLGQRKPK